MKLYSFYIFAASFLLLDTTGCTKIGPSPDPNPESQSIHTDSRLTCSWPVNSVVDSIITDYVSEVVQVGQLYILRGTGIRQAHTGYLGACNLPEEARTNGRTVKLSGYIVSFPGIQEKDFAADPFEITSIEYIKR